MDVPLLLAAVSATSPCGEDMEYDAQFLQLERDAKGQPERSMGDSILPAEPPDWRSIQQQSLDLLQRSKDLLITHFLLRSALALQGVAGLADALTLINALLREYWADLHPHLDADDDNDPTVRINALSGLTSDATIRLLRESILTRSRTFGPVSLRAALNASGLMSFPDEQLGAQQLTSLSTGGSGADDRLTENVTLNFAQVMVDYQPQKADGTKDGGAIKFGWNIRSNTHSIKVNKSTYIEPKCAHGHARGAESLANWLWRHHLGRPKILTGSAEDPRTLNQKTGIIFFKDCFRRSGESIDARSSDHIDGWNRGITGSYDDPAHSSKQVWFWELS